MDLHQYTMSTQTVIRQYLYSYRYYVGIAAAVSLVWQQLYHRVFRVPNELRHIPAIPYSQLIISLLQWESIAARTKRLVFPLLPRANGIYLNKMPFYWTVFIANPALAKAALHKPELANRYSILSWLSEDSAFVHFLGTDNFAFSSDWKRQRKFITDALRRTNPVNTAGKLMPKVFDIIDDTQSKGEAVMVSPLMQRLTLEIIGRFLFGTNLGALDDKESVWATSYNQMMASSLESTVLFPRIDSLLRKFSRGRQERYNGAFRLVDMIDNLAEERKSKLLDGKTTSNEASEDEKDFLTLMLEANIRGDDVVWSKEELLHNIGTVMFAGLDPNTHLLAFILYILATKKDIQSKARTEVIGLLGNESRDIFPTLEECKQMQYLDMIIKETLRMHPPANELFARIATDDVNLGGILVPKGALLTVDIHALQHNPDIWKDPECFIPERFAENGEHSTHESSAWMPFSGGARQCIGMNFSLMEQRVAIAMFLRKYEWELPTGSIHQNEIVIDQAFQNIAPATLKITFKQRYR